jgi:hypothetical protein
VAKKSSKTKRTIAPVVATVAPVEAISFSREAWTAVTGLPLTSCDELVATGQIRSLKVGRRRLFLHADVKLFLEKLARSPRAISPRKLNEERKARGEASHAD